MLSSKKAKLFFGFFFLVVRRFYGLFLLFGGGRRFFFLFKGEVVVLFLGFKAEISILVFFEVGLVVEFGKELVVG